MDHDFYQNFINGCRGLKIQAMFFIKFHSLHTVIQTLHDIRTYLGFVADLFVPMS